MLAILTLVAVVNLVDSEPRRCRPDGGDGLAAGGRSARRLGRVVRRARHRARVGARSSARIRRADRRGDGRGGRDVRTDRRRRAGRPARASADRPPPLCPARTRRRSRSASRYAEEDQPKLDANGVLTTLLVIAIAIAAPATSTTGCAQSASRCRSSSRRCSPASCCPIPCRACSPGCLADRIAAAGADRRALARPVPRHVADDAQPRSLAGVALPLLVVLAAQVGRLLVPVVARRVPAAGQDLRRRGHLRPATSVWRWVPRRPPSPIMTATTKTYGASPRSFLVVPLVGCVLRRHRQRNRPPDLRQGPRGVDVTPAGGASRFVCVYATVRQFPLCQPLPFL